MAEAAFQGTFSDFKLVKTRSCAQFVIEVPLENADAALTALGGLPQAKAEIWVGVARLVKNATQEPKERTPWSQMPRVKQAGILCTDERFIKFMGAVNSDGCVDMVRSHCGIKSRRELDTNTGAQRDWDRLVMEFHTATGQLPEMTG